MRIYKKITKILAGCVLSAGLAFSQAAVTVTDIVTLLEAKMPEAVILAKIKSHGKAFNLTTDDLLRLKKAGAGEKVLLAMVDPSSLSSGAPAPTPSAAPAAAAPAAAAPATDSAFPEIGVYYKKGGQWTELLPEVVNWKTGGVLKNIGSAGIVKKDVNGHIPGPHSRNSIGSPLEFTIFAPEGVAITEYQLIRLRANPEKDYREFRTVTGGVFNSKSGAMRDMVPFEGKRSGPRLYSIVLPGTLGAGEYGFIYLGASGGAGGMSSLAMGKMFTFRLLE